MMNRRELKSMIDQQHESINSLIAENNRLKDEIVVLGDKLKRAKENESNLYNSYLSENTRVVYYTDTLRTIRQLLALDTVEQLTHRARNARLRSMIAWIASVLTTNTKDMQCENSKDIPF